MPQHQGLLGYSRSDLERLLVVVLLLPTSSFLSHTHTWSWELGGSFDYFISGLGVFFVHFIFPRLMSEYIYSYFQ